MAHRYGRKPPYPNDTHPRLYIDDFLKPGFTIPASVDFCSEVTSWPMSLNDTLRDCTIAAANHTQMAWNQFAHGSNTPWTDDQVLAAYEAIGGYVPGDPSTDNGCVMQDVLQYWKTEGIAGDKILAYGAIRNWTGPARIQCLYTFGSIYTGINCPQSAETEYDDNQPWIYVPDSPDEGGHCIDLQAEIDSPPGAPPGMRVVSWGRAIPTSAGFYMNYTEEAWVIVTQDFIEVDGKNPDGIDLQAMNEALQALTGDSNPLGLK
jgi:hypothetical protein